MSEIQGNDGREQKKGFMSKIGYFFSREGQMEPYMRDMKEIKAEVDAKAEAAKSDATDFQEADAKKLEETRKDLS